MSICSICCRIDCACEPCLDPAISIGFWLTFWTGTRTRCEWLSLEEYLGGVYEW